MKRKVDERLSDRFGSGTERTSGALTTENVEGAMPESVSRAGRLPLERLGFGGRLGDPLAFLVQHVPAARRHEQADDSVGEQTIEVE